MNSAFDTGMSNPFDPATYETRQKLEIVLNNLPHSSALPPPPKYNYGCDRDFVDAVTSWLSTYGGVVATARSTHAEMAKELTQLRNERAAIRSFFGTKEGTTT